MMTRDPLSIRLKIAPHNLHRAQRWGDYFFACSLSDALTARGHDVRIQARDGWYDDDTPGGIDLVLRGFSGYVPQPNRTSIMWVISHPGNVPPEELQQYDFVFSATEMGKRKLRHICGSGKSAPLLQCTDPTIMYPHSDPIPSDMLFVGINRRGGRPSLAMAERCGYSVDLYGNGWQDDPTFGKFHKADLIPNSELGRHYAGAKVVLNDHWRDMRIAGYPSNRVFDVLASGAALLTDSIGGLPENLLPWIYMYTDEASFRTAAEAALSEDETRRAERRAFAQTVHAEHSFDARAAKIEAYIHLLQDRAAA